jgi:hypothetical protein
MHNLFCEQFKHLTDEELLSGTARGNDLKYAELMRRYMRSVFRFACQYVPPEEAENITQKTFYTFWRSMGGFTQEKKYRRHLFDIARSLATGTSLSKPAFTWKTIPSFILQHGHLLELSHRLRNPVAEGKALVLELKTRLLPVFKPALIRVSESVTSLQPKLRQLQPRFRFKFFNPYRI